MFPHRTLPGGPVVGSVRSPARHDLPAGCGLAGLAGAACYSSFLVAQPLGSHLSAVNSFVSELEVPGQPANGFFRLTDAIAAPLIVVLALALLRHLLPDRAGTLGCLCLAGVGLASIGDALDPMPCTPSTSTPCQYRLDDVAIGVQLHQRHTISSVIGVVAAVAAMVLLGRFLRGRWPRLGWASQTGGLAVAVLACLEVPLTFAGHWVGAVERTHVLLISAWIGALGWHLFRDATPTTPDRPPSRPAPGYVVSSKAQAKAEDPTEFLRSHSAAAP